MNKKQKTTFFFSFLQFSNECGWKLLNHCTYLTIFSNSNESKCDFFYHVTFKLVHLTKSTVREKPPLNTLNSELHISLWACIVIIKHTEFSPTARWSLYAWRWQRLHRVSTVCGGGPSLTRRPEHESTADPMLTRCEECHRQNSSVSRAGGWELWPRWDQSDASVDRKSFSGQYKVSLNQHLCWARNPEN